MRLMADEIIAGRELLTKMAPSTGLEPVTYGLTVRRSTD